MMSFNASLLGRERGSWCNNTGTTLLDKRKKGWRIFETTWWALFLMGWIFIMRGLPWPTTHVFGAHLPIIDRIRPSGN